MDLPPCHARCRQTTKLCALWGQIAASTVLLCAQVSWAQAAMPAAEPSGASPSQAETVLIDTVIINKVGMDKVIIDTDIGDDVDDAFALALAVKSPELQILGITTAFGDTEKGAKIVDRFLGET